MLLTFDCYGTLIDWETGIRDAVHAAYPASRAMDDAVLGSEFHAIQNRLKTDAYRAYRSLLAEVTSELAAAHGWDGSPALAASVPESVPSWRPFADTNRALVRLRSAGMGLGILSNIDDDLLAGTLEHLEVEFDHLGTAARLRSYKPASAHFELGELWAESDGGRWLHVAQSLFHDIVPATRLGVDSVWVNRQAERLSSEARPVYEAPDLESAAEWILSLDPAPQR
ncbi:MAG: HAD-IA family hydrolase [Gemmatimonadota bacterium]|nr:HAD-IA family hydrolase [Gemmatimonadota bacterium]